MRRRIREKSLSPQASRIRRVLIAFLAAAYLAVGFGGEVSCAEESVITSVPVSTAAASDKADEGSKKTPSVVEHCYTCVPIMLPAAAQVSEPVSVSVHLLFPNDTIGVFEKRFLDPPPPKTSI
jgi:hypothetical protein